MYALAVVRVVASSALGGGNAVMRLGNDNGTIIVIMAQLAILFLLLLSFVSLEDATAEGVRSREEDFLDAIPASVRHVDKGALIIWHDGSGIADIASVRHCKKTVWTEEWFEMMSKRLLKV